MLMKKPLELSGGGGRKGSRRSGSVWRGFWFIGIGGDLGCVAVDTEKGPVAI
jgi:hypothetical protein